MEAQGNNQYTIPADRDTKMKMTEMTEREKEVALVCHNKIDELLNLVHASGLDSAKAVTILVHTASHLLATLIATVAKNESTLIDGIDIVNEIVRTRAAYTFADPHFRKMKGLPSEDSDGAPVTH